MKPVVSRTLRSLQSSILAGILTIGPLFVTYLIFSFLRTLARAGMPLVQFFAAIFPEAWLSQPWLESLLAVFLTLFVLYVVGRLTSLVIGRQAFNLFESFLSACPCRQGLYLGPPTARHHDGQKGNQPARRTHRLSHRRPKEHRLSDPHHDRRDDRQELAAVLLPNAINPTSAFLQILPMERVIETDLTMEQAMSM